ncbi:MAG: cell division protein FtsA [Oligoflexales bacterium]
MNRNVFALDLGTSKFSLSCLVYNKKNQYYDLFVETVPAQGMKRGMISDLNIAKKSLYDLMMKTEKSHNVDVDKVVVSVAGGHLASRTVSCQIELPKGQVTQESTHLLGSTCKLQVQEKGREVLHFLPLLYSVGDKGDVENPVGFHGKVLKGKFFVIDADKSSLRDIVALCNQGGLEVSRIYSQSYVSAAATLVEEQKENGVVALNIGAGTTEGIIYQDGSPSELFSINLGGGIMNNDLAIAFNLTEANACQLKHHFGLLTKSSPVKVCDIYGKEKVITSDQVFNVLARRVYELAELISKHLRTYKGKLGSGIVLTGGASHIKGLSAFLNQIYNVPVLVKRVQEEWFKEQKIPVDHIFGDLSHSASLGLIKFFIEENIQTSTGHSSLTPLQRFFTWLRELS